MDWLPAIGADRNLSEGAEIAELPPWSTCPPTGGTRMIVRRDRPHPGAHPSLFDIVLPVCRHLETVVKCMDRHAEMLWGYVPDDYDRRQLTTVVVSMRLRETRQRPEPRCDMFDDLGLGPPLTPDAGEAAAWVAAELRRLRLERELSLDVFARLVGYSKGFVSKVENNRQPANLDFTGRCDAVLGTGGRLSAVLRGNVAAVPAGGSDSEYEPPMAPRLFVGRRAELDTLRRVLAPDRSPSIAVLQGPSGVGKSALAIRLAQDLRERFPGRVRYVHLRGHDTPAPTTSGAVLDGLLRSLAVPANDIPRDDGGRAVLLDLCLRDRATLVVLDNATDTQQVAPILAGLQSCVVLITTRLSLPGLTSLDVVRLNLAPLHEAEALELLRLRIGARVRAERNAVTRLAGLCANLPLALRLVAARATVDPTRSLTELADELEVAQARHPSSTLDAALVWSYESLPPAHVRSLHRLALHPGPDLGTGAVAALIGTSRARTWAQVQPLVDAHLIQAPRIGAFDFHEAVRAHVYERAMREDPHDERNAAESRLVDWYVTQAGSAHHLLVGRPPGVRTRSIGSTPPVEVVTRGDARMWCEHERFNFAPVVHLAVRRGWLDAAVALCAALTGFYLIAKRWDDWISLAAMGLDAARQLGDAAAIASMLASLGTAYSDAGQIADALPVLTRLRELRHNGGVPETHET